MLSLGIGLTSVPVLARRGNGPAFDPASLFANGEKGAIYDLGDPTLLFTVNGGSTPASAIGAIVGSAVDKSPNAVKAEQATAANRPRRVGRPTAYGPNAAVNSRFATDSDWGKGADWSILDGKASKTAGTASDLTQAVTLSAGIAVLTYTVKRSAGAVTAKLVGSTTTAGVARAANGSFIEYFFVPDGGAVLTFSADATFAGSVANAVIRQATEFTELGIWHMGASVTPLSLVTANIDMSASNKATAVVSTYCDDTVFTKTPFEFGNYYANAAGSFSASLGVPRGLLRGSTGSANVFASSEGPTTGGPIAHVSVFEFDLAAAEQLDQVAVETRGVKPSQAAAGSVSGGGNLGNLALRLGASNNNTSVPMRGHLRRVVVINRKLTADEKRKTAKWVRAGSAICAVLGDSTVAFNTTADGATNFNHSISALTPGMICGAADVSKYGDRIAAQKTKWQAVTDKTALEAVFIQIGINDIGSRGAPAATVISDLQDLVNTINADKPPGCKTYVVALNPCRSFLASDLKYGVWQAVNEAIAGGGATPITGVDRRITSHVAELDDGDGNLKAVYDSNPDGVHENVEGRLIIAAAYRAALVADGLAY